MECLISNLEPIIKSVAAVYILRGLLPYKSICPPPTNQQRTELSSHKVMDTMATSRTTMPSTRGSPPAAGQKVRQVWTPEEDQLLSEAVMKGELSFGEPYPATLRY